jgi:hypothetical protein
MCFLRGNVLVAKFGRVWVSLCHELCFRKYGLSTFSIIVSTKVRYANAIFSCWSRFEPVVGCVNYLVRYSNQTFPLLDRHLMNVFLCWFDPIRISQQDCTSAVSLVWGSLETIETYEYSLFYSLHETLKAMMCRWVGFKIQTCFLFLPFRHLAAAAMLLDVW